MYASAAVHLDFSWVLQVSRLNTWAQTEYPICSVCVSVCVHTHTHTHILRLPVKKDKTKDNAPNVSSVKIDPHGQQKMPCINWLETPESTPRRS